MKIKIYLATILTVIIIVFGFLSGYLFAIIENYYKPQGVNFSACGSDAYMNSLISSKYGESLLFLGFVNKSGITDISLYVNPEEKSFTLFLENAQGLKCIVYTGISYHIVGEQS